MSLIITTAITSLNTSFYIRFALVLFKTYIDYYWFLFCFEEFYVKGDILNLIFLKTDCKKALI